MTDLVLVRHGETVWAEENRYAGVSDIELTPHGRAQADLLAAWAADAGLRAVWASPLQRALSTAAISAAAVGVEVQVDARLRELDFGQGEGMTRREMAEHFPDALDAFHDDPVRHHLPSGESPEAAADRFVAALRDMSAAEPDGRVLVVAHTTAIRLSLCRLLGIELKEYRRVLPHLHNCALTEIRLGADHVSLLQLNARVEGVHASSRTHPTPTIQGDPR